MPSSRQPSPLREVIDPAAAGAIAAGRVAVITGAASGIGRAAALELAQYVRPSQVFQRLCSHLSAVNPTLSIGLKVAIADVNAEALQTVGRELLNVSGDESNILVVPTDVSDLTQVQALKDKVLDTWGEVCRMRFIAGVIFCVVLTFPLLGSFFSPHSLRLGCGIIEQCWDRPNWHIVEEFGRLEERL